MKYILKGLRKMKEFDISQLEIEGASSKSIYFSIIESLLFVSGEPLALKEITAILECEIKFAEGLMKELMKRYDKEERGIQIVCMNQTYQLVTKQKNSMYVQKLLKTNVRQSLSQAALETLAIIAYKQPITRVEIDEIRGVKSDRALYTLLEKKLIKEAGRLEVMGRPILYGTTDEFLKNFALENLKDMPKIESVMEEIALEKDKE